ncbi:MAG: ABC transporter permease [Bacteroidetes bacterium]|jgi:ABC-2 type transport system permease protein|nr:MAG: ABC transporter permease [Bacteroidota bacterium]
MNKAWIVFRREYINAVRKPTFLLSTFAVPLSIVIFYGVSILASLNVEKENYTLISTRNETAEIVSRIQNEEGLTFEVSDLPADSLRARASRDKSVIVLTLSPAVLEKNSGTITLESDQNISQIVVGRIERRVKDASEAYKREKAGISAEQLAASKLEIDTRTQRLSGKQGSETLAFIMGYVMFFLMYMLVAVYGSMLMQSVIEEKSSRVVEVMVSSLKPFQLLLGKILAISAVALTQMAIWGLSLVIFLGVASVFLVGKIDPSTLQQPGVDVAAQQSMIQQAMVQIINFNWLPILLTFPIYFLGGFFIYGSLLAAVGSAVDNIQDAQQFTFPIMLPLFITIALINNIVQNPNSGISWAFSMIPFFSPMAMTTRLAMSEVPVWEVLLSLGLLIGGFLGCVWLAARIYRTGILMYGKKPKWSELIRWVTYRQ